MRISPFVLAPLASFVLLSSLNHSALAQTKSPIDCRTLLSAKEVAKITGIAVVKDPEQMSGDDPDTQIAKGVTTCIYGAPGWVVKLSVYGGPSMQSVFDPAVWKNNEGTALAGIGEGAYFSEHGLNTGIARVKGVGLTFQVLSFVHTPPSAALQSWTEQILKLVASRL
jgi:hypothetical protein